MTEPLQDFIDAMAQAGCAPGNVSEIIADDRRRRFQIAGDKKKTKNGSYQVRIDEHGGVGWFINFKEGVTHKWLSKADRKFTDEERREWVRKREADKKKRDEEIKAQHEAAAVKAKAIWARAERGDHPYLTRKGIAGIGSRVVKGALVVPAYKSGEIVSLQFISGEGRKRFLTDGEIEGAYASINTSRDFSRIFICEGYATGSTIHAKTGSPTIVAFNAGNLAPVAEAIRAKYPNSELIIAADNDQWTEINGELVNVGMNKAHEAAAKVNASVIWPEIPEDSPERHTDFNDAPETLTRALNDLVDTGNLEIGEAAMTADAGGSPVASGQSASPTPHVDWREQLITNAEGVMVKTSLKNKVLFINNHESLAGTLAYDEFHNAVFVIKPFPWERADRFTVRELTDVDITNCTAFLENVNLSPDVGSTMRAMLSVADENRVNPAKDYFNSLKWDGEERLKCWLSTYMGASGEAPEYLEMIGKKWLVAAVKRVFQPGCKFDHVLVMEGKQGAGKSMALRELATFGDDHMEAYFTDQVKISDIQNKDTVQKIQGSIIVELAELAGFNKKDDEEIKSWVTVQEDHVRLPYARMPVKYPRQFVLAATTNGYEYLKDPTGNRRYWPFKVGKVDIKAMQRDREQLWAEAVHLYKEGYCIWPSIDEAKLAEEEQATRGVQDAWEDDVITAWHSLDAKGMLTSSAEIMKEMGLDMKSRDRRAALRVGAVMQQRGFVAQQVRSGPKRGARIWEKDEQSAKNS